MGKALGEPAQPTADAKTALIDFRDECAKRQQGDLGEMWARTYEIAVRVAGVVAFGCYEGGLKPNPLLPMPE